MEGSGLFDYIKNAVSITDYSATTKKLLDEYGKTQITRMTLRRVPISFAIDLALQGVSAGKWEQLKKKYGFDKFFHLSLVVYLKNTWEKSALRVGRKIPKQLSVEKLEVVSVNERVDPVEGQEEQEVPIPKGQKITLDGMFEKTRQRMGETAFFAYSALGANNCQDFVSNLLQSEGLYREPEKQFVFQDLSELAKELPDSTHAISQGYTHALALANKYLGIGGAKNEIIIPLEGGTHRENVLKKWKLEDKGYSLAELASITGVPEKTLQEVYNRGIGAYTAPGGGVAKSVRLEGSYMKNVSAPASKKLSKENWAFARVFSYLDGNPKHDNDLRKNVGGAKGSRNESRPFGKVGLNDLLSKDRMEVGGTKQSGFIRAMMARDKAQEAGEDVNTVENKKKFKYLDKKGFKIQKLTKTTHDLAEKKKARLPDAHREQVEQFYNYVIANANPHTPIWNEDKTIHYGDTYDLNDLFTKWNESRGAEERERRRARREDDGKYDDPDPDDNIFPPGMFDLPKAPLPQRPKVARPVVVPVAEVPKKEEEEDEKEEPVPVLGKFESPRTKFEEEINKLVDYAVSHLHFNDVITEVLNPKNIYEYREKQGGAYQVDETIFMYYYITQYRLPIIDTDHGQNVKLTRDISVPGQKQISARTREELEAKARAIFGDEYGKSHPVRLFNVTENVTDLTIPRVKALIAELKPHFENGEKQVMLFMGIGVKSVGHHSNLLIFRAVDKKLYNIDPHGTGDVSGFKAQYKKVDKVCEALAKGLGFAYVPSADSCPYIRGASKLGFQAIEGIAGHREGFCAWWNAFIVELCCLKPDVPFEALYKEASELLSDNPEKLYRAVVHYQYKLQQVILQIADKAGIPIARRANMDNVYRRLVIVVSDRLTQLKAKRKEILGYAKPD